MFGGLRVIRGGEWMVWLVVRSLDRLGERKGNIEKRRKDGLGFWGNERVF